MIIPMETAGDGKMNKRILTYILTIVLSAVFLFAFGSYASKGVEIFSGSVKTESAEIISVDSLTSASFGEFSSEVIICTAKITSGKYKGNTVDVYQEYNSKMPNTNLVEAGDRVIIKNYPMEERGIYWAVDSHRRTPVLIFMAILFFASIIILGKTKGLRTVVSLIYTCAAVFCVFIPWILSGKNIYAGVVIVCGFITLMTLLLVNGFDRKTLCAFLGCAGGVVAAALITIVFSWIMNFSGYTNEHSYYLTSLPHSPDLSAIAFSAVLIGAVGAVMDVAMSMSSSLYELSEKVPDISFGSLVASGFSIGRDMMGTMANTLVLAYVGSSLTSVLLILTYSDSISDILNKEAIAYEILQAIAGSMGILLAIPVTAFFCGVFYIKNKK